MLTRLEPCQYFPVELVDMTLCMRNKKLGLPLEKMPLGSRCSTVRRSVLLVLVLVLLLVPAVAVTADAQSAEKSLKALGANTLRTSLPVRLDIETVVHGERGTRCTDSTTTGATVMLPPLPCVNFSRAG